GFLKPDATSSCRACSEPDESSSMSGPLAIIVRVGEEKAKADRAASSPSTTSPGVRVASYLGAGIIKPPVSEQRAPHRTQRACGCSRVTAVQLPSDGEVG